LFLYGDKNVVEIIKNCKIVRGEILDVDIGIERGTIKEIGKNLDGEHLFDAKGMLVLPGGIDVHVHFREPVCRSPQYVTSLPFLTTAVARLRSGGYRGLSNGKIFRTKM